jgi:hypothetical protein
MKLQRSPGKIFRWERMVPGARIAPFAVMNSPCRSWLVAPEWLLASARVLLFGLNNFGRRADEPLPFLLSPQPSCQARR